MMTIHSPPTPVQSHNPVHLPWLDGFRGIAALWVLCHHAYVLTGGRGIPFLSWGKLAVDLFMILSGFLMAHHYLLRKSSRPWESPSTWKEFWARRWFRISPLYYLLLIAALLMGSFLGGQRDLIAQPWPATATASERYSDFSVLNIFLHLSYVFGVVPEYSFRTAIQDWSIGLEMQFYLAFPFIMLLMHRWGVIKTGFFLAIACLALRKVFPQFFASFPMPSFLPLKLYVFLVGIWLAYALATGSTWKYFLASMALAIIYVRIDRSTEAIARVGVVAALYFMVMPQPNSIRNAISAMLSCKLARRMGDASYGLYLLHLLLMIPIVGWLSTIPGFVSLHMVSRLIVATGLTLPLAYAGAWLLYRYVELPGIAIGKQLLSKSSDQPPAGPRQNA